MSNIVINARAAKGVFFSKSGAERQIARHRESGTWLVNDAFDDEDAITFIAKKFELKILSGDGGEVLERYKNGSMTLVVSLMNTECDLPVTQTIKKIGRYDVVVFKNATVQTLKAIMRKAIELPTMVPDEEVVRLADLAASTPPEASVTNLDRVLWVQMTRSLEKTPVRKRRNWSFPIDVPRYGKSVIKFENGKFVDYTQSGVQDVVLLNPDELCGPHNDTTDVVSAYGALIASVCCNSR